jgi:diacylglycerol kinase (ATP)
MAKKIYFIIHGKIFGRLKLLREIDRTFRKEFVVIKEVTSETRNAEFIANEAINEGVDYLIAVGGDGTINQVANAYLHSAVGREIPIGIIPVGRGNDFVKSLGVKKDLNSLLQAIQNNRIQAIDIGLLTFQNNDQKPINRFFINIADIGLGGLATQTVNSSPKFLGPDLTYAWAIFKSLISFRSQKVKINTPDWSFEGAVMSVCMANGKYFGSGLCIAPEAKLNDGIAEIVLIGNVSIWDYIKKISKLKKGKKIIHPEVFYKKAKSCVIESHQPMPIDLDGDFVGCTPLKMEMIREKIKFLV